MAVISKKSWSNQMVLTMERIDISYALAGVSNRCNEDQRKYSLLKRTWRLVLSMERIPSKLGHD